MLSRRKGTRSNPLADAMHYHTPQLHVQHVPSTQCAFCRSLPHVTNNTTNVVMRQRRATLPTSNHPSLTPRYPAPCSERGEMLDKFCLPFFSLVQRRRRERSDVMKQTCRARQHTWASNASEAAGSQVLPSFLLKTYLNSRIVLWSIDYFRSLFVETGPKLRQKRKTGKWNLKCLRYNCYFTVSGFVIIRPQCIFNFSMHRILM